MASELTSKRCLPCEGGIPKLQSDQIDALLPDVPGWSVSSDGRWLERKWSLPDFRKAVQWFQTIADLADAEDHHPDLHLTGYRKVRIAITTHAVGGLTENDFILAAKISELPLPE
ncbi:4a-hydroxytetrahydrobiopterin dehydratase [Tuwongella immobilis]|uniref:4a-hydroxytetrahydrobiopterin dehydratase n=1 Tax=Tuwongella immobilis TaxID=692036 RepID=A0A6C2YTM3_9BACT|nr:4a-hydroxytetrahydrobiopterin dehydratase [Tuwongella immobilis]VIP04265.1 pterin-4-alpha-carbinolamine dehydratase : 4a-hydroxytetrahydrobiopterin dehydratase OS=Galdieria sulphuraria GN=Gasu_27700 PE=4 SV=1: Pterin_4a [Tuwongella immobilis]VTS05893.1 pterin-4-alpha-carbinolamine dehydratase : 4a-hydroxytetrahydrobiopterin dehydratase OS=Galdieria sulphuraria GN=Gasu_27700 PE=4 SV=1: Pterin_4a [Tuwongella immobilis]